MTRRATLILGCLLAGCSRAPVSPDTVLPPAFAGWRRLELSAEPLSSAPPEVRALGLQYVHRASYQGPGSVQITLYSMASSTAAFELAQKWRPAPHAVAFYQDNRFIVLDWRDASRSAVQAFIKALRNQLKSLSS